MQILMNQPATEAQAALGAAVAASGWRLDPAADPTAPLRLTPCHDDGRAKGLPAAGWGWVVLEEQDGRTTATVWLPDGAEPTERERLESALDGLQQRSGEGLADEALLRRLRRIEGQIRGLQRMIESGRECEAVLTQFAAVTAALKQTAAKLVSEHLVLCIREEIENGGDATAINQRLLNILF